MRKQLIIEVRDQITGDLLATWTNANLAQFSKEINGGLSEAIIQLAVAFDYAGTELVEGNDITIKIADSDLTPGTTRTIYSGYISLIESYVRDYGEGIDVHVLGYHTLLGTDVFKDGTTTTMEYTTTDIGAIMRDIIDKFNAANATSRFTYDTTSIPTVGEDVDYSFQRTTYKAAMEKTRELAPATRYFYIDETNKVTFKAAPTTPTHTFVLGRHFSSLMVSKGIEKVRNGLLLWDGVGAGLLKLYSDSVSQSKYGRRTEIVTEYGMAEAVADLYGARFLAENQEPSIVATIRIMDNSEAPSGFGYDIESVQPGDTCAFNGFSEAFVAKYLSPNMLITKVVYNMTHIELTIDAQRRGILDTQFDTRAKVAEVQSDQAPTSYTT